MDNWKENLRLTELHTDDCDDWDILERFIEDLLKEAVDFAMKYYDEDYDYLSIEEEVYKRYGLSNTDNTKEVEKVI